MGIMMNPKSNYSFNRPAGCYQRKINSRDIRKILIVCEGEKTEPNYFNSFPKKEGFEVVIEPAGMVVDSVVEKAIKLKDKAENGGNKYHQVWCVFDRDSNPKQNFNQALQLAGSNGIQTAYSIEAFELWYLLHFEYMHAGISRAQYCEKLSTHLGKKYEKNSVEMYKLLKKHQQRAIKNAENLYSNYSHKLADIYDSNPSTTVHLLVKELKKYLGLD